MQAEVLSLRSSLQQLEAELKKERSLRLEAEKALELSETERTRLQNARDELSDALLHAERRVGEAEQAAADTTNTKRNRGNNKKLARGDSLQADLEILLREIDQERKRSDDLEVALETASADVERAILSLCAAAGVAPPPPPPPQDGEDGGDTNNQQQEDEFDVIEAAADIIKNRISVLKSSRDKLIAALDSQSIEMDKLGIENSALQGTVLDAQLIAEKWEVQVQASLVQNELLKDLLEESASWDMPDGGGGGGGDNYDNDNNREETNPTSTSSQQQHQGEEGSSILKIQNLERQLLKERAKTAELDLAARAMCAELTRVSKQAMEVERCMVPILGNVETRLAQVMALQPRPGIMNDQDV